jgi:hypothetical protein
VKAPTRTSPAALVGEIGLGGERGEDLADPLGVESEGTKRHVAVLWSEHHGPDGGNLGGGELTWARALAGGAIVKMASQPGMAPGMVAGGFEAENFENHCEREDRLRGGDRAKDVSLGLATWDSSAGEAEAGDAEQGE